MFLSCRLRKFVTSLLGYLGSFGVFILAKFCGSFNKFNTYFLRSLDSNLFFVNGFFYKMPIHKLTPKREAIKDKLLR